MWAPILLVLLLLCPWRSECLGVLLRCMTAGRIHDRTQMVAASLR